MGDPEPRTHPLLAWPGMAMLALPLVAELYLGSALLTLAWPPYGGELPWLVVVVASTFLGPALIVYKWRRTPRRYGRVSDSLWFGLRATLPCAFVLLFLVLAASAM